MGIRKLEETFGEDECVWELKQGPGVGCKPVIPATGGTEAGRLQVDSRQLKNIARPV